MRELFTSDGTLNCRKIDDDVDNYDNEDENLASRHNKSRIESYTRTTTTMTTSKRMFIKTTNVENDDDDHDGDEDN